MSYGQTKSYQDELEDETNKERIAARKRPFTSNKEI